MVVEGVETNVTSLVGWDIKNNEWFAVQQGMKGIVYDLELYQDDLYIGGRFNYIKSGTTYNNFAKLKVNQTNIAAPQSVIPTCSIDFGECQSQIIFTIELNPTVSTGNQTASPIYIGGVMDTIQAIVMNNVARLVDDTWVTIGSSGVTSSGDSKAFVMSLALTHDYEDLYIGGYFTTASSIPVNDIVVWSMDEQEFTALAPVEGWEGYVFDILPTRNFTLATTESTGPDESDQDLRPVTIGLIFSLIGIVFCLMLIIVAILFAIIKYRPRDRRFPDPEDASLSQSEKESWEGKLETFVCSQSI